MQGDYKKMGKTLRTEKNCPFLCRVHRIRVVPLTAVVEISRIGYEMVNVSTTSASSVLMNDAGLGAVD